MFIVLPSVIKLFFGRVYRWGHSYFTSPFKWHSSTLMLGMIWVGTQPASSIKKSAYARVPLVSLARSLGSIRPISLQYKQEFCIIMAVTYRPYIATIPPCSTLFCPQSHCQTLCPPWQFNFLTTGYGECMLTEGNETVWLLATEGILKLQLLCVFWPGCQFTSHSLVTGVDIFTVHHICFFQVCVNSLQDSSIILFPDKLSKPLHGIGVQEDVLFSNTVHTKQQHIIYTNHCGNILTLSPQRQCFLQRTH